jgi:hypothetical protein
VSFFFLPDTAIFAKKDMEERIVTAQQLEYFNTSVRGWGMSVKRGLKANARSMPKHDSKKRKYDKFPDLSKSVGVAFGKQYGIISSINFRFGFQGYFIHMGVGRGYIREGNTVKRGRKYAGDEIGALKGRGYTSKEIKKMRYIDQNQEGVNRTPVDWFDVEIKRGVVWLAEYAGDFWGERAMESILDQMDKGFHIYAKYVKVRSNKKK